MVASTTDVDSALGLGALESGGGGQGRLCGVSRIRGGAPGRVGPWNKGWEVLCGRGRGKGELGQPWGRTQGWQDDRNELVPCSTGLDQGEV